MNLKVFWRNIIWTIVIFILCSIPGNDLPGISVNIPYLDKIVHFGMFFVMSIFLCSSFYLKTQWNSLIIGSTTMCIIIIYGGLIEILQNYYFINRSGDLADFIADITGGIFAVTFFPWLKKQKDLLLDHKIFSQISFLRKIL